MLERFNAERDHDYAEIIEQCEALLEEFERETGRARFSYAALEDTESNLERIRAWLERVSRRDFFDAPKAPQAREAMAGCKGAYDTFARRVVEHTGGAAGARPTTGADGEL